MTASASRAAGVAILGVCLLVVALFSGVTTADPVDLDPDTDLTGSGTEMDPYIVTNASELQAMNENLSAHYELGQDINASNTSDWNGGAGFTPIGNDTDEFGGTFDGFRYEIENLSITRNHENYVGLFGYANSSTAIGNLTLTNANVTGNAHVGALVGESSGTISEVTVDGDVTTALDIDDGDSPDAPNEGGGARTGGVVGMVEDSGTVANVTASVNVTAVDGGDATRLGGLVGYSLGEIRDSKATGDVEGLNGVGGLIGRNVGHIENATATGNVTGVPNAGTFSIGGLAGYNGLANSNAGTITLSHATGTVSADDGNQVGGLIGANIFTVNKSYATGTVEGTTEVGGLVGHNQDGIVKDSYANGSVTEGTTDVGGLVGLNSDTIETSYAVVDVPDGKGGLVGNTNTGTVTDSYWDSEVAGVTSSDGGEGLSTGDMQGLNATVEMFPFDFNETWRPGASTDDYPDLAWDSEFENESVAYEELVDGDGSEESPYNVTTIYELQRADWQLDDDFEVKNDINATNTSEWYDGDGFLPIGDDSDRFTGMFNGSGHVIESLTIDRGDESYIGLFGSVGTGGVVENLGLKGGNVTGDNRVGGMIGVNRGTVRGSNSSADVDGSNWVGGLVGEGTSSGTVSRSYATGSVTGSSNIGGLIGLNPGTISESYATGSVAGSNTDVGGLVGKSYGMVEKSYATGPVEGSVRVGGLIGFLDDFGSASVSESYSTGTVEGNDDLGGLVGYSKGPVSESYWDIQTSGITTSVNGTGLTTYEMTGDRAEGELFAFGATWENESDDLANGYVVYYPTLSNNTQDPAPNTTLFADGDGSDGTPYEIETWNHLNNTRIVLDRNVTQIADLDDETDGYEIHVSDSSLGFEPIGNETIPFTGTFNGSTYAIDALQIDRENEDYVGLFGSVGSDGIIENVGLTNVDVTGNENVSALVGYNGGTVSTSYVTGAVEGTRSVGGLVGYLSGKINNSYATAAVTGEEDVGGLAGHVAGDVTQAYSTGAVEGNQRTGGLLGNVVSGSITDAFWDRHTSGQNTSGGNDEVGLTTYEMTGDRAEDELFAFGATWENESDELANGYVVYYPTLSNNTQNPAPNTTLFADGDGSDGTPYEIETWNHLNNTRLVLDSDFELVADLSDETVGYGVNVADPPEGFLSIGNETSPFTGTFDGDGRTIDGLVINRTDDDVGLFGYVGENAAFGEAELTNVTLSDVDVAGGNVVGALVGNSTSVKIENVTVSGGSVEGSGDSVGGLIGVLDTHTIQTNIADSHVELDNVTGVSNVGGVVGSTVEGALKTNILDSSADVSVEGHDSVGGFIGWSYASYMNNVTTAGIVNASSTGDANAGGLVGRFGGGTINRITIFDGESSATVSGDGNNVGGLVGVTFNFTTNSSATGDVTGVSRVGGLVGVSYEDIDLSNAAGNVTGESRVGGLVGTVNASGTTVVSTSYASGSVRAEGTSGDHFGGLIGEHIDGGVQAVYATGSVDGNNNTGGLIGSTNTTGVVDIEESFAVGAVSGDSNTGGLIGFRNNTTVDDSYWDEDRTGLATSDGGTGLQTTAMIGSEAEFQMTGLDFFNNWETVEESDQDATADGYPILTDLDRAPQLLYPTVDDPPEQSGGDGSRSSSPSDPELELTVTDKSTIEATGGRSGDIIRISDETTGRTGSLDPGETIAIEGLSIELANDRDFWMDVETFERDEFAANDSEVTESDESNRSTVAATFETQTGTVSVGYVTITHNLEPEDIASVDFEFSVRQQYLDEFAVDTENVNLFRQTDDWSTLPTNYVGVDGSRYQFNSTSSGFSSFAIGTGESLTAVTGTTLADSELIVGESATVTAIVENRGEITAEHTVELVANGETVATATLALGPSETGETILSFEPGVGEYDLTVEGHALDTLTVGDVTTTAAPTTVSPTPVDRDEGGDGTPLGILLVLLAVSSTLAVIAWRRGLLDRSIR